MAAISSALSASELKELRRHDRVEAGLHRPPRRDRRSAKAAKRVVGVRIRYNRRVLPAARALYHDCRSAEQPRALGRRVAATPRTGPCPTPRNAPDGPSAVRPGEPAGAARESRAGAGARAGHAGARGGQGQRLRARARCACCRRWPTPTASRCSSSTPRSRCATAHYTRRILLLEGFFARRRAARDRRAPARRCRAQRRAGADAGARAPRAAARGVRQGQHRDEPPGVRAGRRRARLVERLDALRRRSPRCG